jgi:hypothetical protein
MLRPKNSDSASTTLRPWAPRFHQPHDHSEFGSTSRTTPLANAFYTQLFFPNAFPSQTHEGYLSSLNLHIMSEIRRKLVIVGDGACGKVSVAPRLAPG